jgi:hypothetical protein
LFLQESPDIASNATVQEMVTQGIIWLALFPSDVVDIQSYVEGGQFDLVDLCFYIMMLNSLEGAMRYDGYNSLSFKDFESHSHLWKIKDGPGLPGIIHLAQAVREKNNKEEHV